MYFYNIIFFGCCQLLFYISYSYTDYGFIFCAYYMDFSCYVLWLQIMILSFVWKL